MSVSQTTIPFLFPGDSQPMDVCSIHHNHTFLRYSVSLLGYGFYGDVLTDSERKRWMGPARYDISGQQDLHNNRLKEIGGGRSEVTTLIILILSIAVIFNGSPVGLWQVLKRFCRIATMKGQSLSFLLMRM